MIETHFQTRCISSLAKVFADEELRAEPIQAATALSNETYAYQIAYRSLSIGRSVRLTIQSDLSPYMVVKAVALVPSELPCYADHDDDVLRTTPGLYPDPLLPLEDGRLFTYPLQWRSVWITVELYGEVSIGTYPIEACFESDDGERLGIAAFNLTILGASLPEQRLIHTEWLHTDCIAEYYGVDVFSDAYWHFVDQYVQTAVKHGINMILTPIFTPPLDTAVGGERLTVQLVSVHQLEEGQYQFEFDQLLKWITLCRERGVVYFEFSHLFTQWGAKHAPKIIGLIDGEQRQLFGWDTDAGSEEYASFLRQFIPELLAFLRLHQLESSCYFHVSDEPNLSQMDDYRKASDLIGELVGELPVLDALSDYEFYQAGIVKHPVPSSDRMELFLQDDLPARWMYYCCGQYKEVSNRFFSMHSSRNRILGFQLYKLRIEGFLHWGFNFWNTQYSRKAINPYMVTDAGGAFPSGDAFLVYPGEDGPVESIRLKVLFEAMQDMRALQLLEQYIGFDHVVAFIEDDLPYELSLTRYPRSESWLLSKRERLNRMIMKISRDT